MIYPDEIKKGMLVRTGERGWSSMGVVLQDELKYNHHNHYAYVYYFDSHHRRENPCWAFTEILAKVEK